MTRLSERKRHLTQGEVRRLLHYEPSTGIFTWLVSPSDAIAAYRDAALRHYGEFAASEAKAA